MRMEMKNYQETNFDVLVLAQDDQQISMSFGGCSKNDKKDGKDGKDGMDAAEDFVLGNQLEVEEDFEL